VTLKDSLGSDLLHQLQQKKHELAQMEEKQRALEEQRKREERKKREKNKSFEELLNESEMDWKKFK
jgi:hypothetical protein